MIPRVALAVAGLAAALLPLPDPTPIGLAPLLIGLVALWRAVMRPDGPGAAGVLGAAALSWLVSGGGAAPARLVVFALALATVHSSAALAAGVPWRARVDGRVLLRWAARTVGTTLFGVGVVGATALLPRTGTPVATVAAGVVAVTAAVVAGAVVALRRPHALTRSAPTPEP